MDDTIKVYVCLKDLYQPNVSMTKLRKPIDPEIKVNGDTVEVPVRRKGFEPCPENVDKGIVQIFVTGKDIYFCDDFTLNWEREMVEDTNSFSDVTNLKPFPTVFWENPEICHWRKSILILGEPEDGEELFVLEIANNSGAFTLNQDRENAFPGGGFFNQQITQNTVVPGQKMSLGFEFFDGQKRTRFDQVDSAWYGTCCFTGGKIVSINKEHNDPEISYDVEINGDVVKEIRPTDFVKWNIGDWVFVYIDECSTSCDNTKEQCYRATKNFIGECKDTCDNAYFSCREKCLEDKKGADCISNCAEEQTDCRNDCEDVKKYPMEYRILPLKIGNHGEDRSRYTTIDFDIDEITELWDTCIYYEAMIIQIRDDHTADIEIDTIGRKNNVEIFYHCPDEINTINGWSAFEEDDIVDVLCFSGRSKIEPKMYVVGHSEKPLKPCIQKIPMLVLGKENKKVLIRKRDFVAGSNGNFTVGDEIKCSDGGRGFVLKKYEEDNIIYMVHTAHKCGATEMFQPDTTIENLTGTKAEIHASQLRHYESTYEAVEVFADYVNLNNFSQDWMHIQSAGEKSPASNLWETKEIPSNFFQTKTLGDLSLCVYGTGGVMSMGWHMSVSWQGKLVTRWEGGSSPGGPRRTMTGLLKWFYYTIGWDLWIEEDVYYFSAMDDQSKTLKVYHINLDEENPKIVMDFAKSSNIFDKLEEEFDFDAYSYLVKKLHLIGVKERTAYFCTIGHTFKWEEDFGLNEGTKIKQKCVAPDRILNAVWNPVTKKPYYILAKYPKPKKLKIPPKTTVTLERAGFQLNTNVYCPFPSGGPAQCSSVMFNSSYVDYTIAGTTVKVLRIGPGQAVSKVTAKDAITIDYLNGLKIEGLGTFSGGCIETTEGLIVHQVFNGGSPISGTQDLKQVPKGASDLKYFSRIWTPDGHVDCEVRAERYVEYPQPNGDVLTKRTGYFELANLAYYKQFHCGFPHHDSLVAIFYGAEARNGAECGVTCIFRDEETKDMYLWGALGDVIKLPRDENNEPYERAFFTTSWQRRV